jgi:HAD superfamily hydrolase (TIGR01490 family)
MTMTMALFDLDGTLSRGHMWGRFLRYYFVHKRKRGWIMAFWAKHLALWLVQKCRVVSEEELRAKWVEDLTAIFTDANRDEVLDVFGWVSEKYLMQSLRRDVIGVLNRHKDSGHMVVLISANFTELLEIVGRELGVPAVVGTRTEVIDGRYTGKVIGPVCFGMNKASLLKEFIDRSEFEVDLSSSFAYADSISDSALLKLVGHPVATYPDKALHQFALRYGWQILA